MKILDCIEDYYIGDGLWVYEFNVTNVPEDYIEAAREEDGENYGCQYFCLRVYYQEKDEYGASYISCSILYVTNEGDDLEFDYEPTAEDEKFLSAYVGKED